MIFQKSQTLINKEREGAKTINQKFKFICEVQQTFTSTWKIIFSCFCLQADSPKYSSFGSNKDFSEKT